MNDEKGRKAKAVGITVRQTQRNRIFFMVVQPIQGILQLILWIFIWVNMPIDIGIYIIVISLLLLQVIVWKLDTSNFFQMWRTQESKSKDAEVLDAQVNLQAARWAKFMKMSEEKLNQIELESMAILGIKVNKNAE